MVTNFKTSTQTIHQSAPEDHCEGAAQECGVCATHDEIARRAYDIYVRHGGKDGHCKQDWGQAERELMRESQASAKQEACEKSQAPA